MNNRQTTQSGFSLIEILVAFSILSLALGILLNIFSSGLGTAILAEEYTVATQIAESLLAETGVEEELQEGERSGTEQEKYHWTVSVGEYQLDVPEQEVDSESQKPSLAAVPMQIQVRVSWGEEELTEPRSVELSTLRFAEPQ